MSGRGKRAAFAAMAEVRAERDRRWACEIAVELGKVPGACGPQRGLGHYILEGREVIAAPFMEWATWFQHAKARIVEQTSCRGRLVSTVFLGLDHNWAETGPPLLFETMVFATAVLSGVGTSEALFQCRWSTYDEAAQGHAYTVALTEAGAPFVAPSDAGRDG